MSSTPASRRDRRAMPNWDLDALWTALQNPLPVGDHRRLMTAGPTNSSVSPQLLEAQDAERAYAAREAEDSRIARGSRCASWSATCCSNVGAVKWREEHLYEWTTSREGIEAARDGTQRVR